ncbi:MAG: M48 family metallopeptidase [Clostridiales bacterium]|nr:M48 family metallopeptidase [Clostridiales bacterium]
MEEIAYKVIRGRRRTLTLNVEKNGEVVVRAPLSLSDAEISRFVKRHRRWVLKRLAARQNIPQISLADGERITIFGKSYLLATGRTRIAGDTVFLPQEGRAEALARLLKPFCYEPMFRLTQQIAERYGFAFSRVRISSARSRWGSCNRERVIAYTFRLAFLPPEIIEYIAVHELCHTVCFNHSTAFWREVSRILPDYKVRRSNLKSYGYLMDLFLK